MTNTIENYKTNTVRNSPVNNRLESSQSQHNIRVNTGATYQTHANKFNKINCGRKSQKSLTSENKSVNSRYAKYDKHSKKTKRKNLDKSATRYNDDSQES